MSPISRRLHLLLSLIVLLAAMLVAVGVNPHPGEAKNSVEVDNRKKTITITVHVSMIGDADKVAFLTQAFNSYWGKPGYTYKCYKVIMKLDIKAASSREPGRHTVFMVPTNPGDPWVSEVSYPRDYNPTTESATGRWSDWDDGNVVAHEFGHVLGLPDEYSYPDKNKNGKRDYNEPSTPDPNKAPEYTWTDKAPKNGKVDPGEVSPKPGQKRSLLAEWADGQSEVLQRHIDSIVNKHAPRGSIECGWTGKGSVSETPLDDGARKLTRSAEFEFDFEVDEDGKVTGEITLTYAAVLTVENLPGADVGIASFDPEVGGEITDPNPTRTFPLTGTLEGDELTLEIETPEDDREPIEFTIIADPGVSAGLGGGGAFTAPGSNVQIIQIPMTPFTPFAGPATVEEGPDGSMRAEFFEEGDNYRIEWSAELAGGEGEPVGYVPVAPIAAAAIGDRRPALLPG